MKNGEWRKENEEWGMGNGKREWEWGMGKRNMTNGKSRMGNGK